MAIEQVYSDMLLKDVLEIINAGLLMIKNN